MERRRPRPRSVVDWLEGICWGGGERADERRRLRPRWISSVVVSSGLVVVVEGEEVGGWEGVDDDILGLFGCRVGRERDVMCSSC